MTVTNNKKSVQDLLSEANAQIDTISIEKAKQLHIDEGYIFVDLRDVREVRKSGKIPKSFSCPRGMLEFWIDPDSPYHKEIFNQEKTFVFYCASGWRSALSTKTAIDMGLENACHIDGGFSAWVKNGGEVENID